MAPVNNNSTKKRGKEEKVFHPDSRKAKQLERKQLRKSKLEEATSKKARKHSSEVDRFAFFYHAMPPDTTALTLEELHAIVRDIWLARFDVELEEERKSRRKGRPKSAKEMKLELMKTSAEEEYRTGLEVPDLTDSATVELLRRWDESQIAYMHMLRFIRIFSDNPSSVIVSRPGKHFTLTQSKEAKSVDLLFGSSVDPPLKYSSTMTTMDETE